MNKQKNPLSQQRGAKNEYAGKYLDVWRNVFVRIVIRRVSPVLSRSALPENGAGPHGFGASAAVTLFTLCANKKNHRRILSEKPP